MDMEINQICNETIGDNEEKIKKKVEYQVGRESRNTIIKK
jgi:hypothetical protein